MNRQETRRDRGGPAPHDELLDLIRALPTVDARNTIMRVRDTDLALCLIYMAPSQRERVIALAGPGKGRRVREALSRLLHTRILYQQYESTIREVILALNEGSTGGTGRTANGRTETTGRRGSYYRPTRSR